MTMMHVGMGGWVWVEVFSVCSRIDACATSGGEDQNGYPKMGKHACGVQLKNQAAASGHVPNGHLHSLLLWWWSCLCWLPLTTGSGWWRWWWHGGGGGRGGAEDAARQTQQIDPSAESETPPPQH